MKPLFTILPSTLLALLPTLGHAALPLRAVDFGRDVRPILANHCLACHGQDESQRKADLRLDTRDGLASARDKIDHRITAIDDQQMPPAAAGKPLSQAQIDVLQQWIAQGAPWAEHWSFIRPVRPPVRILSTANTWAASPIDLLVQEKMEAVSLASSPEARPETLLRRATLDLTGLPPTLDELDDFLAQASPDSFQRAVDRLLASPRYGEHRARDWLDAARYADTHGYFTDHERYMWRWRDWVIRAFNANQPFDQFTIEQLAGDLLPDPTQDQLIATGLHRNHMVTEETGVIAEEYRIEYVADRVRTTAAIWLGLTAGCAQCHDHKFDPLTQREFYQLFAYFNNVPEQGVSGGKKNAPPILDLANGDQQARLAELQKQIGEVNRQIQAATETKNESERLRLNEQLDEHQRGVRAILLDTTAMIMRDQETPRDTFVLTRGQYDQLGQKVTAGVPAFLPPLAADAPPTRLTLAQWLVRPDHPLTARVAVNRVWRQMFGQGLVSTHEDFGIQGELPSHPELLDFLAVDLVASGWDIKRLERDLITSATWRQSSTVSGAARQFDPKNHWLSRASRHRLDAEVIRDSVLFAAGLLDLQIGGPSVKPYQPADLWKHIIYDKKNTQAYDLGQGAELVRRGMYTYWKRQIPPPTLQLLDAPSRETCVLRRQRTNTPLQALALMNDVQFVEAAGALAQRILSGAESDEDRITMAFRLVVSRTPTTDETARVRQLLTDERRHYRAQPELARQLAEVGQARPSSTVDPVELAAWTIVGNLLLNLDETLNRE